MTHQDPTPSALQQSDLAAQFALDSSESTDLDPVLQSSSEFKAEVAALEAAATAMAYSLPLEPLAPDLKARLFERIAPAPTPEGEDLFALLTLSIAELRQQATQLDWEPLPVMAGASVATWKVDKAAREAAIFIRAPIPGRFPNHRHADNETLLILEGDLEVNGRVYLPGERIDSEPDTCHAPSTPSGCLIFCVVSLDNKFID